MRATFAIDERPDPKNSVSFILLHLLPLGALWSGASAFDWALCFGLYYVRMVGITAGYHRYFSHRSYKASRPVAFLLGWLGAMAGQKGPLWWAAHHRNHHKFSDTDQDVHSPKRGFWWSHVGWIVCQKYKALEKDKVPDLLQYPELVWIDRNWWVPPTALGVVVFLIGGWSALFIGFGLSTVLLYHGTFTINSLSHLFGSRRFATTDTSRNNVWLALVTCGEGWHNNHHHYQLSARQGFYWWEVDVSWYVIRTLEILGLVWDVRRPTERALHHKRIDEGTVDVAMQPPEVIPVPLPVAAKVREAA